MMEFQKLIVKLTSQINRPLPGKVAHSSASPIERLNTYEYLSQNPSYKSGCVTMLVFPDHGDTRMLLIERADGGDVHSGQISFPGGKREMDDQSLEETALRETYEEVGIDPASIQIIGQLSDLYIPASNYLVHPFLCFSRGVPETLMNPQEVKSILLPPIDVFMIDQLPTSQFQSKLSGIINAPYYPYKKHRIWGATAMMIREMVELLKD